ncbi:MAG: glycosyltransferase family 4 protein [Acidobacteriota bacterium]|nr:glycosyltransferase family 4 protein [Acidobacteriota bacterium]
MALNLNQAGCEVEIWAPGPGIDPEVANEILDGIIVRRFHLPLPGASPTEILRFVIKFPQSFWKLRKAIRGFQPDVIHVQCFGPNGAYATVLSQFSGTPLVVSLQGETLMDDSDIYDHSSTLRAALRAGLRRAVEVTACSAFTLRDAEERFGLPPGRGQVVFNGVDTDLEAPAVPSAWSSRGPFVFAVGRLVDKKGFDLLIKAFAAICDRHPDVGLILAGAGRSATALAHLITDLGLDERVTLVGRLSREEVAAAMTAATAFVMPSRLEPFGIVVLEAWRAGTPVIASSVGGAPEFVEDGRLGLVVDPHDTAALAGALDRVLADPVLRNELGSAGKRAVADFSWARIAATYREVYGRAVSARR